MFNVSYDKEAQAAYLRFSTEQVARTEELIEDVAWMDIDDTDQVIGVEIIGVEDEEQLVGILTLIRRDLREWSVGSRENLIAALG